MEPFRRSETCLICFKEHHLRSCPIFLGFSVSQRLYAVRVHGYCANCLSKGHKVQDCVSTAACRSCGRRHNSVLHRPRNDNHNNRDTPRRSVQDRLQLPRGGRPLHERVAPPPNVRRLQRSPRRENSSVQTQRSECSEETDSGIVQVLTA